MRHLLPAPNRSILHSIRNGMRKTKEYGEKTDGELETRCAEEKLPIIFVDCNRSLLAFVWLKTDSLPFHVVDGSNSGDGCEKSENISRLLVFGSWMRSNTAFRFCRHRINHWSAAGWVRELFQTMDVRHCPGSFMLNAW